MPRNKDPSIAFNPNKHWGARIPQENVQLRLPRDSTASHPFRTPSNFECPYPFPVSLHLIHSHILKRGRKYFPIRVRVGVNPCDREHGTGVRLRFTQRQPSSRQIKKQLMKEATRSGRVPTTETIYGMLIERARSNLHLVVCMSPIGDAFRNRLRQYPALINCTTIDWFLEWPREALLEVGNKFLMNLNLTLTITGENKVVGLRLAFHSSSTLPAAAPPFRATDSIRFDFAGAWKRKKDDARV